MSMETIETFKSKKSQKAKELSPLHQPNDYLDRSFLRVFLMARYYLLKPPPLKKNIRSRTFGPSRTNQEMGSARPCYFHYKMVSTLSS